MLVYLGTATIPLGLSSPSESGRGIRITFEYRRTVGGNNTKTWTAEVALHRHMKKGRITAGI